MSCQLVLKLNANLVVNLFVDLVINLVVDLVVNLVDNYLVINLFVNFSALTVVHEKRRHIMG